MIWEIVSVEEGERSNDVLLTVNYWHEESEGDIRRPDREPDFTEHHAIIGAPFEERRPKRTPLGQFVGVDGSPVMEWEATADGELVQVDPRNISEQIEWVEIDEDAKDDLLIDPVEDRARQVAREGLIGNGRLPVDDHPVPARSSSRRAMSSDVVQQRQSRLVGRLGVV